MPDGRSRCLDGRRQAGSGGSSPWAHHRSRRRRSLQRRTRRCSAVSRRRAALARRRRGQWAGDGLAPFALHCRALRVWRSCRGRQERRRAVSVATAERSSRPRDGARDSSCVDLPDTSTWSRTPRCCRGRHRLAGQWLRRTFGSCCRRNGSTEVAVLAVATFAWWFASDGRRCDSEHAGRVRSGSTHRCDDASFPPVRACRSTTDSGPVVGRRDRRDLGRVVADVLHRTVR